MKLEFHEQSQLDIISPPTMPLTSGNTLWALCLQVKWETDAEANDRIEAQKRTRIISIIWRCYHIQYCIDFSI